jgi:hypothetical protein
VLRAVSGAFIEALWAIGEELSFRMVVSERKRRIRWHTAPAHVIAFDRRTYPALIKLHLNGRFASVESGVALAIANLEPDVTDGGFAQEGV